MDLPFDSVKISSRASHLVEEITEILRERTFTACMSKPASCQQPSLEGRRARDARVPRFHIIICFILLTLLCGSVKSHPPPKAPPSVEGASGAVDNYTATTGNTSGQNSTRATRSIRSPGDIIRNLISDRCATATRGRFKIKISRDSCGPRRQVREWGKFSDQTITDRDLLLKLRKHCQKIAIGKIHFLHLRKSELEKIRSGIYNC